MNRMLPTASRAPGRTATRARRAALLFALVLLAALAPSCKSRKKEIPPAPRYTLTVGARTITVEVALNEEHRKRGLMFRKQLGPDEGMLFVYPSEDNLTFWMKNTYAPLSIAFIRTDGWIAQIEDMEPLDLVTHRAKMRVKYALEMPQGWFARNGVKEGDMVKIPDEVAQAATWD